MPLQVAGRGGAPEGAAAMSLCHCAVKHGDAEADGCCFAGGTGTGVKVFLHWSGEEERERCQTYTCGTLSAEEICIDLSRRIGE